MTAQLPEADYVELKGILEDLAATMGGADAELRHDERMGLALLSLARRGPRRGVATRRPGSSSPTWALWPSSSTTPRCAASSTAPG